ncbi:MAG: ABC transporter substrate-binding protein [Eubacteriales bacterium]
MMKRIVALLLCAVTVMGCFVGCSKKDSEDKGQYITMYLTDNIYDLDPAKAYQNEALSHVVGLLFDTLFTLDENGKVKKSLVEKYWFTEDANTEEYILNLRLRQTYWSDGTAISGNDVVFAWKRLLEVDASYEAACLLFDIKNARAAKEGDCSIDDVGIYATEEDLVEIRFEESVDIDQFLLNLTSVALAPLRSDVVAKSDDWAKKAGTMVCSGPFKLSRVNLKEVSNVTYEDIYWSEKTTDEDEQADILYGDASNPRTYRETVITDFMLERNAYYYREASEDEALDVTVKPYKICVDCSLTDEQLLAAYKEGMVLYIGDVPLALRNDETIQKAVEVSKRSLSTNSIYLNENAMIDDGSEEGYALFANEKVRQALSMAIDRQALADSVVYADPATGLVPTGVFETGASRKTMFRDACNTEYQYLKNDMAAAKQLLSEAGITPSKYSFTLTYAAYDEVHTAIAEAGVKAWKELGFQVELNKRGTIANNDYYKYTDSVPLDLCDDLYAEDLRNGTYEAILLDCVATSVDPFSVLAPFAKGFSGMGMDMSTPGVYEIPTHMTGYNNEAYNELIEAVFAEKDIAARADKLREAESILMNDLPVIPLIFNKSATVTNSQLKNLNSTYYVNAIFTKAKISKYDNYLAAGKAYINANFSEMKFTECNECAYKDFEIFKSANTVYAQFYLDEKEKK